MSRPAVPAVQNQVVQVLAPARLSRRATVLCECCRERKSARDFDMDGCGICNSCLECDTLLVQLDSDDESPGAYTITVDRNG